MSREETIMKEVEDCFEYFDKDGYDEEFLSTPSEENITDLVIKHENDILKEFVEWYNCRLQKILVHEQELYDSATQQNHIENATFYLGEKTMLERLIYWLNQDLENFVKEKL